MAGGHSAREVSAGYGELALVGIPAIDLPTSLGWRFRNLYGESFGEAGADDRENGHRVIPTRRFRAALVALNPGLPAAYAQAIEQLAQDRPKTDRRTAQGIREHFAGIGPPVAENGHGQLMARFAR